LQHVRDHLLPDYYVSRTLDPLARVGIVPSEVMPLHLSPPGARRRTTLRATWRDGRIVLGFSPEGGHSLVDVLECPVLAPELAAVLPRLRALLRDILLPRAALGLSLTLTESGVDLLLANLSADRLPVIEALGRFAMDLGLARLSVEGPLGVETVVERAPPVVRFGGVAVALAPGAFLQATADGEAALLAAVLEIVGNRGSVADLFAGYGTFALPLSAGARVTAVEGAAPAIRALDAAQRGANRRISCLHRDLFRKPLSPVELAPFDAVVIDPPRAGASAQMAAIAASRVPLVAAVSCNPATFARDAAILVGGGYRLQRLWPIAQFRWSSHVELVAAFARG
jgi:23S rRNA (uracil1939-C5)-methyltransferase